MVQLAFDARAVEPRMGFDPIPSGWYKALIGEADMKPTKSGTGSFLNLQFSVLEGQYANMKVFARLNIDNPNAQAKEIAFRELSTICHAIGIQVLQDSEELKNKPMYIRVKKRSGQKNAETGEEYDDSNEIKSYKNINDPTVSTGPAVAAVPGGVVVPPLAAPVAAAPVAAPVVLPPVAAAPVLDPSYKYTPDFLHRWKEGMAAWELVPVAAPPTPPLPPVAAAPPPPPGGGQPAGWQGAPAQPWAAAATAPVAAAAPAAPPAPPAVTGAKPPWST